MNATTDIKVTDWQDLRVDDLIQCIGEDWSPFDLGQVRRVITIDELDDELPIQVQAHNGKKFRTSWGREFIFISRP